MTLYTSYYVVDSPLNQELEPLIRIRKRDLAMPRDPVQGRMLLILAVVLLAIALFVMIMSDRGSPGIAIAILPADLDEGAVADSEDLATVGPLSTIFSPEVQQWKPEIIQWSAEHDLDPNIVATIMQIESCGDPQAISSAGARGLFQVMPFHFVPGEDMLDPDTNALRGLSYFSQQLKETGGNIFLSFAGYNGGSAASSSGWDSWVDETKRYYVWSKGIYEEATSGADSSPTLARWMEAGGASLCQQASSRLAVD
jgi:soluble lytic murein transglycosylase-like protein